MAYKATIRRQHVVIINNTIGTVHDEGPGRFIGVSSPKNKEEYRHLAHYGLRPGTVMVIRQKEFDHIRRIPVAKLYVYDLTPALLAEAVSEAIMVMPEVLGVQAS
jgi:hypothetical protein